MSRSKALFLTPALLTVTLLAGLLGVACQQLTPEEKVAQMRSRYEATVNTSGFVVRPHEAEVPVVDEFAEEGTEEAAVTDEGGEGEEGEGEEGTEEAAPAEPTGYDVILDILVSNRNDENLDQLTIDIVHVDSNQQEKGRYWVTIDASGITKGGNSQEAHTLENIPFVEGDGFTTEVRHPVPEGEKSNYPELVNAGQ